MAKNGKKGESKKEEKTTKKGFLQKVASILSYPITHQDQEENDERGNWGNPCQFIFACLGFTIGLGNVWRFPYLVYKYGGGTFLLIYWFIFFLVAFPTFFMELALGQFTSSGPVAIFRNLSPALEGVGYATLSVQVLAAIYYNSLVTISLFYTGSAMQTTMPWDRCHHDWNSKECFTIREYKKCVNDDPDNKWYIKGQCYDEANITDFLKHVDSCLFNSFLTPDCIVKLDFDFGTANISIEEMVGRSSDRKLLFQTYDNCLGKWLYPKELNYSSRSNITVRLDLELSPQNSSPDQKKEILKNLHDLTNRTDPNPVSQWVKTFCENQDKKKPSKIACLRQILRPLETYSSQEYFNAHFSHPEATVYDLKGFFLPVPFVHLLSWILVSLAVVKGPQWMGKIVYVTAIFPIVMILVLLFFSFSLDGFMDGVKYYMKTDFCKLKDPELWFSAMGQVFFSLSIGGGGLMTLASYNKFHNDLLRDSIIIAFGNCIFSFISGFAIFGFLGFMAKSVNTEINDILRGVGPGLTFVTLAQATTVMPGKQFWAICFFLMLSFLAIDSEFCMLETILSFLFDEIPPLRRCMVTTVCTVAIMGYLLGLPMVSRFGMGFLDLVDGSTYSFLVPMCVIVEIIAVAYIYGIRNFMDDITFMFGANTEKCHLGHSIWKKVKWYFGATLVSTAPLAVMTLLLWSGVEMNIVKGFRRNLPEQVITWGVGLGIFLYATGSLLLINLIYRKVKPRDLWKPRKEWGPSLNETRAQGSRYEALQHEAWK